MLKTKADWIKVGFEVLTEEGINGVKVETMARKLGVTKGSFYGYFPNRNTFLLAMLEDWKRRHNTEIINRIKIFNESPYETLQKLLYVVDDMKYDALELSIYSWAAHDPAAKEAVSKVVNDRLKWITAVFLEGGFSKDEAEKRAHIVHHFMAGCKLFRPLLPASGSRERQDQIDHFLNQVVGSVD